MKSIGPKNSLSVNMVGLNVAEVCYRCKKSLALLQIFLTFEPELKTKPIQMWLIYHDYIVIEIYCI